LSQFFHKNKLNSCKDITRFNMFYPNSQAMKLKKVGGLRVWSQLFSSIKTAQLLLFFSTKLQNSFIYATWAANSLTTVPPSSYLPHLISSPKLTFFESVCTSTYFFSLILCQYCQTTTLQKLFSLFANKSKNLRYVFGTQNIWLLLLVYNQNQYLETNSELG
jgi:hypothetical protein